MKKSESKLDIKKVLNAVDTKNYNFYEELSEDERKGFNPYLLMRFTSNYQGDRETYEEFVLRTNEYVNKDYRSLSKDHKDLLWRLYAAVGIGVNVFHPYLAAGKKENVDKIEKLLSELYPSRKIEDIKIMASLMTKEDRNELFDKMGFDKKQKKEYE